MFFKKKDKKVFTLSEKMEEVFQRNVKPIKDKLGKGFVEFEISFTNSVYNYSNAILNLPDNSSYDEEEEALGKMKLKKYTIPVEEIQNKFKEIEDWTPKTV